MTLLSALKQLVTILVPVLQSLYPWNEWNGVCNTAACKHFAAGITHSINPDVKPCDNFYQFVCGNYLNDMTIRGKISRIVVMELQLDEKVRNILQEKPKRFEPRFLKSMKRFFHLCMDENKMDDRGAAPGLEILKKLGGWPVLGNWDSANWNMVDAAIGCWQLGLEGDSYNVINIDINLDHKDSTKRVFKVDQPKLPIPIEYLVKGKDEPVVKEYFQYMVNLAMLFGADGQTAEKAMENVLQLQIDLAKVVASAEQRQGINQKIKQFTLKELDEDTNKVLDWRKLFEGIVSPIKLQDDEKINFYDLEVINKILALFNGYSAEIVGNYVTWNVAKRMSPYLTTEMRNLNHRLNQVLRKSSVRVERWQECINEVNERGLDVAVSAIYVKRFFKQSTRNTAKALTKQIQTEMDQVIRESVWMDDETRKKAQQKSAKIRHVVGYPDELADMTKVEEHYKELNLNSEHFFEALLGLNVFTLKSAMNGAAVKRPWILFSMSAKLNAYYSPNMNAFFAAAGILQEPMFSPSVPSYFNYGGVGTIIGHELTHAFDNEGRQFNEEGERIEWWDEASLNKFNEKKKCVIDQYSSFIESTTKRKVNGVNTQSENIADNGGLKLAYRAYRRQAQLKKPEPGLPGLTHYSNDQLFFISFAKAQCTAMSLQTMVQTLLIDVHAPSEWRVNGPVMNMPEFGNLFGCAKGTPMNPIEKCEVW